MAINVDSIIETTLKRMTDSMRSRSISVEQSAMIYMGNIHDSIPRQLLLDKRLSSTDKMMWMMIRLYAQQNQGAIFPSYDELQSLLASPHSERASRSTIAHSLHILRLTGWLSLVKRVRDKHGIFRGNIYAQHDEPISLYDANHLDPSFIDLLESSCFHTKKSIRLTAIDVLNEIKNDSTLRHQHSRLTVIENRLSFASDTESILTNNPIITPSTDSVLGQKDPSTKSRLGEISSNSPSLDLETPSTESILGSQVIDSKGVRNQDSYVRNNVNTYNTYTYVTPIPKNITALINQSDLNDIQKQLDALEPDVADLLIQQVSFNLANVKNVTGYFYAMLKKARENRLNTNKLESKPKKVNQTIQRTIQNQIPNEVSIEPEEERLSKERVRAHVESIKAMIANATVRA